MRCAFHPSQGRVGVCAPCLRQRLQALVDAEAREDNRKSDTESPPAFFPRSVSPYVRRRSGESHHQLFYRTPQIGPRALEKDKKGKKSRFSLLSSLFGASRQEGIEKDPRDSKAPTASSWFSALRWKKSRLFSLDDEGFEQRAPVGDRGMSPERGEREHEGHSYERSPALRKSVSGTAGPLPILKGSRHGRDVSGFAFCLSPLVWPSPSRHKQKAESGFSLDLRNGSRRTPVTLCTNRSRKIADFGRYHH